MSEWLNKAFSGGVSMTRVNPVGIAIMILAVILIVFAQTVSSRCQLRGIRLSVQTVKLAGLLVCALGTAVAIL